jgi:hypothetical protein
MKDWYAYGHVAISGYIFFILIETPSFYIEIKPLNILYRLSALPFAKHIFHIDVSSSPDPSD